MAAKKKARVTKSAPGELTPKQQRFCDEYLLDGNGGRAAEAAGYGARNARRQAYRMLQRPHIIAYIEQRRGSISRRLELQAEDILQKLELAVDLDPLEYFNVGARGRLTLRRLDQIPPEVRRQISELKVAKDGHITLRLASKERALELLARIKGMLVQKHQVSGPDGGPIEFGVKAHVHYYFPGPGRVTPKPKPTEEES